MNMHQIKVSSLIFPPDLPDMIRDCQNGNINNEEYSRYFGDESFDSSSIIRSDPVPKTSLKGVKKTRPPKGKKKKQKNR